MASVGTRFRQPKFWCRSTHKRNELAMRPHTHLTSYWEFKKSDGKTEVLDTEPLIYHKP